MIIILATVLFSFLGIAEAHETEPLTLNFDTKNKSLYPAMDIIKDYELNMTIDDVTTGKEAHSFIPIGDVEQKSGFFQAGNWLRFDVDNRSKEDKWLIEFSFALIHELKIYEQSSGEIELLYSGGANLPFHQREVNDRYFIYDLDIQPGEKKTYYAYAVGSGDLHPPISIWQKNAFIEKTQFESTMLGLFYGIILVMISYNLFLYFSLRMRSYLYYVIAISFTLLGKMAINGTAYQYLWPHSPEWNIISAPIFVALGCSAIVIFTRNFLDMDTYTPSFRKLSYVLIGLNGTVIITMFISRYIGLYLMVSFSLLTFLSVLIYAVICLIRGARQARFYIVGWVVFLTGVSITILERAVVLPFTTFTEYAGQMAITFEIVLLSLALADKIKIIREEKEAAEKESQRNKELAIENLRKADELKDEFLAVTSHELRTPLYGMIGIAQSLRDGVSGQLPENANKQLSFIIASGERLTKLVNEILDFSKLKYDSIKLDIKPVHVHQVLNLVIAIMNPLLTDKNIRLINNIDDALPPVRADQNRLQQMLHNLLDNAIKYTDEGEIIISAYERANDVTISITDTGRGISDEQLEHIFQPFEQGSLSTSRDVSGVGIGLSITKNLVDLHSGSIHVESEKGVGSTFSITLPIHDEASYEEDVAATVEEFIFGEEAKEVQPIERPFSEKRPTILVADDEYVNLQVLMNQLSLEGYDVITVLRGEDVFQVVEEREIDLVILDIMMPGKSGYDVCKQLRETYTLMELPILMLTAKNQLEDKVVSFEAGANDYLVKPTDKQELLSRVKTLVRVKMLNQELIEVNAHLEDKVTERTYDLKVANEDLHDAISSRQQLLANIAHELGTPVTLIHNYLELVQKEMIDVNDSYYQGLVTDKINVLNRLIEDLYDLALLESKQFSFNLKEEPLDEWLTRLIEMCEFTTTEKGRLFTKDINKKGLDNYICFIDHERMNQLFNNLISNAVKNTDEEVGEIHLAADVNEGFLYVELSDNGFGIRKENLPHIFERFFKRNVESNEHEGTGLGLPIVKQIIDGHRGNIYVESKLNEGTTFYMTLPLLDKELY